MRFILNLQLIYSNFVALQAPAGNWSETRLADCRLGDEVEYTVEVVPDGSLAQPCAAAAYRKVRK
jgi:hypothetical protein